MNKDNKKYGVLLVNLGTPDAPTAAGVKQFLSQFLHDHRVVDMTRWLWCPILHGVILPIRSPKVAKLYQSVWMEDGSPLMVYSKRQQKALTKILQFPVELGMTYGNPSTQSGLERLKQQGCDKVLVLPLYPQYSGTTTAAVFDRIAKDLKSISYIPELRFINHYYDHPDYISALAETAKTVWAEKGEPDYLLCSYHGIPKRYADNGDPYPDHCNGTTELLAKMLEMPREKMSMSYQSIFGREEWLKPYTEGTIKSLAEKGVKRLDVMCPAFSVDCLETLEEIAEQCKEVFIEAGGVEFNLIPCLNDSQAHITMMENLVKQHVQGWE
ncbi:ferrochelatase [Photobacterium angustum]|uniref:ferrochelatase n=1 Tax=Photobacterium angustum TaxID=661 RepID=UPI0005DC5E4E|nr:ferrochelatase [Photobacterium angustum]KJF96439.1 ferrochelatase [Photobacterium angustum]KJG07507.1 ferrochelatase [Photobacterium angustum]PSV96382.1 ferrochelatase [Photobacterium angustum]PSW80507.1 ferrochelatase [Photobacterium angustum]